MSLCGCDGPVGASFGLGGQFDRALQERSGSRQPGPSLSRGCRLFELRGYGFVRSRGRSCQMPHATLWIDLGIGRSGERPVRSAAIVGSPGSVGGRPNKWMAETHVRAELEQLFGFGRCCRGTRDAQSLRGAARRASHPP